MTWAEQLEWIEWAKKQPLFFPEVYLYERLGVEKYKRRWALYPDSEEV